MALPHWLRECIQVTDQDQGPEQDENVLAFPRRPIEPVRNDGQSAIDLVCQAAEVVGNLHDHADRNCTKLFAEPRAKNFSLLKGARTLLEKALNLAESRIASAEARLPDAESGQICRDLGTRTRSGPRVDRGCNPIEVTRRESEGFMFSRRGAAA